MKPEDFTFFGRMKKKLKINSISESEWSQMRRNLLTEGKTIFGSINKLLQKSDMDKQFYEAVMECYDERINTLPKEPLYDLYLSYEAIENSPDREQEIFHFGFHTNLTYSLDGWFMKKLAETGFWHM